MTFPEGELDAVRSAMLRRHPTGQRWGWNVDGEGLAWVDAHQGVDLQVILDELGLAADVEQHGVAN